MLHKGNICVGVATRDLAELPVSDGAAAGAVLAGACITTGKPCRNSDIILGKDELSPAVAKQPCATGGGVAIDVGVGQHPAPVIAYGDHQAKGCRLVKVTLPSLPVGHGLSLSGVRGARQVELNLTQGGTEAAQVTGFSSGVSASHQPDHFPSTEGEQRKQTVAKWVKSGTLR